MAEVFAHDGTAVFSGVWSSITSAKQFDSTLLNIPKDATHWVRYTTGATAALSVGETLTGGTSNKTTVLVAQAVETGTAGSSDTGILFLKTPSGAMTATGETLTGGTSTGTVAIIQAPISLLKISPNPKALLISVETASLIVSVGGVKAGTTATTNFGITLSAGQSMIIRGKNNISSFYAINAVDANGAIMKYFMYF